MLIRNRKLYKSIKFTGTSKYIAKFTMLSWCNGGGQITYSSSMKLKRQKYFKKL